MQAKIFLNLFLVVWGLFGVFVIFNCFVFIFTGKLPLLKGVTTRGVITPGRKKFIRIMGTIFCICCIVVSSNTIVDSVKDTPYAITDNALKVKGVATYVLNGTWNIGPNSVTIGDELTGESVNLLTMQIIHTGDYIEAIYYPNTKLSIITEHNLK